MRDWGLHAQSSPLYDHLVEVIAEDADLLRVINRIENRPPPNVLFGAVHYMLLEGADHELAEFYPNLVATPRPFDESGGAFRDFVLDHEDEIVRMGRHRYTQTNECRRCVALLPGLFETGLNRFHLIEIGTSAGLNLAFDLYRYSWDGLEWGPNSTVLLETELRAEAPRLRDVEVLTRTGLDLNPIDPLDAGDRRWLDALIWPEHAERRRRLRAALELAGGLDMELVAGDALETLEPALASRPSPDPVVVMDSFSLNQFSAEARQMIDRIVTDARRHRTVARVSLEPRREDPSASLKVDTGGGWRVLGRAQHHGGWLELYARP